MPGRMPDTLSPITSAARTRTAIAATVATRCPRMTAIIAKDRRFCPDNATDHPTVTVTLFRRAAIKRVEDYLGCFARSDHSVTQLVAQLRAFEKSIDSTAGSARWVRPAARGR